MRRPKKNKRRKPIRMGAFGEHPEGENPPSPNEMMQLAVPVATSDRGGDFTAVAWSDSQPMTGFWATGDDVSGAISNALDLAMSFISEHPMDPELRDEFKRRIETVAWPGRHGPFQGFWSNLVSKVFPGTPDEMTFQSMERAEEPFVPEFRPQQDVVGPGRFFDVDAIFGRVAGVRAKFFEKHPPGPNSTQVVDLATISPPTRDLNELIRNVANYFGIPHRELDSIPREGRLDYLSQIVYEAVDVLNREKPNQFRGSFDAGYTDEGWLILEYGEGGRYGF